MDRICHSLLFVCTANICRSPLAEAIMKQKLKHHNQIHIDVDSAGITPSNIGSAPHPLSCAVAHKHGLKITHEARIITSQDFERFNLIFVMDKHHLFYLKQTFYPVIHPQQIHLITCCLPSPQTNIDVSDPFQMGAQNYETMFHLLNQSCQAIVDRFF